MKTIIIKVLTFNIHHGKGLDNRVNLRRISKIIQSSGADIIGLNEVDKEFSRRSDYVDQAKWLANELKMNYAFGPAITRRKKDGESFRQYGNALLSHHPIVKIENHPFDFLPQVVEDRALLEAEILIGEQILTALVTHLSFAPFLHQKQSAFILNRVKNNPNQSILMGDWNMKPLSKSWKTVSSLLKDVHANHGSGFTFPSRNPIVRLDYIFVSRNIEVLTAGVYAHDRFASDHLPYMATLQID